MKKVTPDNFSHLVKYANHHRWVLVIVLGLILGVSNLLELSDVLSSDENFSFFVDITTGFLVPLMVIVLQIWLERSERKRQAAERQMLLQKTLSYQISKTTDWNELIEVIIQFPRTIIPYIGAFLWLYDKDASQYLLEVGWGFTGMKMPNPPSCPFEPSCPNMCVVNGKFTSSTTTCTCVDSSSKQEERDLIVQCISFTHSGLPVGLLYCYLQKEYEVTSSQKALIASISPIISQALVEASNKDIAVLQSNAVKEERSRIAKNLHDTVAQDLFYLRLQLDQFTNADDRKLIELVTVQDELVKLRNIADSAYSEIRKLLDGLENERDKNFVSMLTSYADLVAKRSMIEFTFLRRGTPQILPLTSSSQIINIYREILANIENHAQAQHVNVELAWDADCFALSIKDDGLGFDLEKAHADGHYGLKIMQERAVLIKGELKIDSFPGQGTQVKLTIPLGSNNKSARSVNFRWLNTISDQKVNYEGTNSR
jgi:signal transduction histidine kinase